MTINSLRSLVSEVSPAGDAETIDRRASLFAAGVLDSLAMASLVPALEQRFGIRIHPTELMPGNFDTLQAMGAFVDRKVGR